MTPPVTAALGRVLQRLEAADYAFVMPTQRTLALVSGRLKRARPGNLRDVFGWGRPFTDGDLGDSLLGDLAAAEVLARGPDGLRLTVAVSTLDGRLHLHSRPGEGRDAVFLGPDSYRFVRLVAEALGDAHPVGRALDIGTGSGAGAMAVAARRPGAVVTAADVNPRALGFAAVNMAHAGLGLALVEGSGLEPGRGPYDLIVANPPYIADRHGFTYRDGGDLFGAECAVNWVREGLELLSPGGRFVLYTGAPVIEGRDVVRTELERLVGPGVSLRYEERDPDIFGGTLARAEYAEVERIAAVGAVLQRDA